MSEFEDKQIFEAEDVNAVGNNRPKVLGYVVSVAGVSLLGLLAISVLCLSWPPRMAINVVGGAVLVYEIWEEDTSVPTDKQARSSSNDRILIEAAAMTRLINPGGTEEVVILPYGARAVEIIVREVGPRELDAMKKRISMARDLQFRIVANARDHAHVISLAQVMTKDPANKRGKLIRDHDGTPIGKWAHVSREQREGGSGNFKVAVARSTIRDADTGDLIQVPPDHHGDDEQQFTRYIESLGIKDIDVVIAINDNLDATGRHLGVVGRGNDERLHPFIEFNLTAESGGISRFARLTTAYGPEGQFQRQLGILLDDTLLTAPNIREPITNGSVRITNEFTDEEIDFFVSILQAASLAAVLRKEPVFEERFPPAPSARKTMRRILEMGLAGLLVIWLLMLFRYRWIGAVAAMTGFVQLLSATALLMLMGDRSATFSVAVVALLLVIASLVTLSNAVVCELNRRDPDARSYALINVALFALLFILCVLPGSVIYAVSGLEVRHFVTALILSGFTATVLQVCLWLPPAFAGLLWFTPHLATNST